MKKIVLNLFLLVMCSGFAHSQDSCQISLGVDLYSRYVWRGLDYGASPNIQPCLEMSKGNITLGAWGAYAINLTGYQEMDLYLSYNIKDILSITVTDYFFPTDLGNDAYFGYGDSTGHVFEGMIGFAGTDKIPVSVMLGYNFYGADPNNSVYIEFGYSIKNIDLVMGLTPAVGFYGDYFGVVNLGVSSSKDIKITEDYSLPLSVSLIANPQKEKVFFIVGLSF